MKISLILMALFMATAALHAQERMRAGNWEMTTVKDGKTTSSTHCFTAADVKPGNGDAQSLKDRLLKDATNRRCSAKDIKIAGNTVSYILACANVTVASSIKYSDGNSVEIVMKTTTSERETTTTVKERRIGSCP
jgi:hypothetical protein